MQTNLDVIPSSLEQAVDILFNGLTKEECEQISRLGDEGMHFGLGLWCRNNWELWIPENPLPKWFHAIGIGHADDMSGLILSALVCKVRGTVFNLNSEVELYRKHWLSQGIDPVSGLQIDSGNTPATEGHRGE